MNKNAVEFKNISMRFGETLALQNINLTIEHGAYVVLLGPSGGGKTTLLNILGGFLQPATGSVLVDGEDVTQTPPAKRPTTTVFQDYALFPHMTVAGNIAFGLKMRGVEKGERERKIKTVLELVGLADTAQKKPHELSGGQRQRIALARALVVEPKVLLLDEPLGALDMKLRRQLQTELKTIQKRVHTTFVHVTHDQEEAMAIADQIVVMNKGGIEDIGEPERIYLRPKTLFTAQFMGENNLLDGVVESVSENAIALKTDLGEVEVPRENAAFKASVGDTVVLSMRPEHLSEQVGVLDLDAGIDLGEVSVIDTGFMGTHHQTRTMHKALKDFNPIVRQPQAITSKPGDTLRLNAQRSNIVVLRKI